MVGTIKQGLFPTTIFIDCRALVEGINDNNVSFIHRLLLPIINRAGHVCSKYNIRVVWCPRSMNWLAHGLVNFVRYHKLGCSSNALFCKLISYIC